MSPIVSGDELKLVWTESEVDLPEVDGWVEAFEDGRIAGWAARKNRAVGFVAVRKVGIIPEETEVAEMVAFNFPNELIYPVYALHIHPDIRSQGIATLLMENVHRDVPRWPNPPSRLALWVETTNKHAITLYNKLGYEVLQDKEKRVVTVDAPKRTLKGDYVSDFKKAYVMAKELTEDELVENT